ncbi:DUF7882 family protein [Microbacterium sp. XT11]|uniref:DUF7882 family protein n=1 Tax=Microbacterium sp. XT11 TaxID=367477 RepID=UPI00082D1C12|nr:ATP-dependent DNA ligase [Microbacterium sp. XT11]
MGTFIYEGGPRLQVDDRTLAHLQLVVTEKLRRRQPFSFSWREDPSVGGGRTTVWVHAGTSLTFSYGVAQPTEVNRAWLEALALTADSPGGLHLVPEPVSTPSVEQLRAMLDD